MSNIISDSVSKLSAITDHTPIDWDAFDSVLKGLEDINAYDEHYEETILSEFMEMSRNVQSGNTQNLKSSAAPVRLPAAPASTPGTSQAVAQAGCVYRP